VVPPAAGFLEGLRTVTGEHGALLILDEVITGFRVGPNGAAALYGVTPDLIVLGKVLGGGMPLAAFGGRAKLMSLVAPSGPVYQAGTYAAHPLSVAAALATLSVLDGDPGLYERLEAAGRRMAQGLEDAAARARVPLRVQRVGSMWTAFFSAAGMESWDQSVGVDRERYGAFFRGMLGRGVLLPPSQFECAFLSLAHGQREIDATLDAARAALEGVAA
jgi:glutamate-1-semialdehyde 2,1-aminomutase